MPVPSSYEYFMLQSLWGFGVLRAKIVEHLELGLRTQLDGQVSSYDRILALIETIKVSSAILKDLYDNHRNTPNAPACLDTLEKTWLKLNNLLGDCDIHCHFYNTDWKTGNMFRFDTKSPLAKAFLDILNTHKDTPVVIADFGKIHGAVKAIYGEKNGKSKHTHPLPPSLPPSHLALDKKANLFTA